MPYKESRWPDLVSVIFNLCIIAGMALSVAGIFVIFLTTRDEQGMNLIACGIFLLLVSIVISGYLDHAEKKARKMKDTAREREESLFRRAQDEYNTMGWNTEDGAKSPTIGDGKGR